MSFVLGDEEACLYNIDYRVLKMKAEMPVPSDVVVFTSEYQVLIESRRCP